MTKLIRTLGVALVVGILAAGCDSVVDSDSALTETDVTIQSENSALSSGAEIAAISSPEMGEVVYENSLMLTANDPNIENATKNDVHWALVAETNVDPRPCTGDIKFNRVNDPYTFSEDGYFEASVDLQELEAGEYCFVFNTELENPDDGERVVHYFYIVDEYAKVGGTIGMGKAGRGNSPTHTFDGLIGDAGDAGIVGEIKVNYRMLSESCVFTPQQNVKIGETAPGIGVDEPVRANGTFDNSCGGTAAVWLLGTGGLETYTRGALVIWATDSAYDIDLDPTTNAPPSNWYPVERGNIHVGTR